MRPSISFDDLKKYADNFDSDARYALAMNTVTKNGINNSALTYDATVRYQHAFSIDVESGDVCDQQKSGRCWMFASLNVMRLSLMKKLNLPIRSFPRATPSSMTNWRNPIIFWRISWIRLRKRPVRAF